MTSKKATITAVHMIKQIILAIVLFAVSDSFLYATDLSSVKPGDKVSLNLRCIFTNGDVAIASDPATVETESLRKSFAYVARTSSAPLVVEAMGGSYHQPVESAFEDEVLGRISHMLAGKKRGETSSVRLSAQDIPARDERNYTLEAARVRKRPKLMRMSTEEFKARAGGREPTPGAAFTLDPNFPGRVESVNDGQVTIAFTSKGRERIDTPFGAGTVVENESGFEVVIDAQVGRIVRTGPLVGRIVKVDHETIVTDYRHPFGGEELECVFTVVDILPK